MSERIDWRGLGAFVALAFGGAWLVDGALFLTGGASGSAPWLLYIAMAAPAVATLIVTRWIRRPASIRRATGLVMGRQGTPWVWMWLVGWLGVLALAVAAPFVGALLGVFQLDLANLSGARTLLAGMLPAAADDSALAGLVLIVLLTLPLQALVAAPAVFLEEWGWRGYLLPQLLPLGTWPALVLSGALWGLWHIPAVLAGLNYPGQPLLGSLAMVGGCIVWGVLFGWMRLASGSVWPAVLGHAALNTAAVVPLLLAPAATPPNLLLVGVTGVTGWIVPCALILLLVATRRLPPRHAAVTGAPASPLKRSA